MNTSTVVTILWDMQIHTDRELSANKPDIVIKDHANQCCKLTDVSVPSDRNTLMKVIEKFSKYKDLDLKPRQRMGRARDTREGGVSCVACLPRAARFFLRLVLPPATQVVRVRIKCSPVVESVVISLLQCLKLIKASRCSCLGGLRKRSTLKTWSY